MSGQLARDPGGASGAGRGVGTGTVRSVAANPPPAGAGGGSVRVLGRGTIGVGRRSARALLIAAVVSVARNGSPASTGAVVRCPGTTGAIGVMPGGGGGGAEIGRFGAS